MGFLDIIGGGIGGLVGDLAGAFIGQHSASEANRANIKNAREQRAWEERLANTAVQRRADDFEKAGFNRVLAATGVGAATPSVAVPTTAPTFDPNWIKGSTAANVLMQEQLRTMRTNNLKTAQDAALTGQEARIRKVEADAAERYGADKADWDYQKSELSVKEAKARLEEILARTATTAAQGDKLRGTTASLIKLAEQQAREGEINLDALENVARIGGVEAGRMSSVMKTLMDLIRTLLKD